MLHKKKMQVQAGMQHQPAFKTVKKQKKILSQILNQGSHDTANMLSFMSEEAPLLGKSSRT